jgi:hypothetical protein
VKISIRVLVGAFCAALLLGSCAAKKSNDATASAGSPTASSSTVTPGTASSGETTPRNSANPASRSGSNATPDPSASASPGPFSEYKTPIDAKITPTCVARGTKMTLVVHLVPKSAVAYIAYYAAHSSGAPKPWGKGYGGNDSGLTDAKGDYTSTWTVASQTPGGKGEVDVYANIAGGGKGFKSLPFTVAAGGVKC